MFRMPTLSNGTTERLERLERFERFERFERVERLERFERSNESNVFRRSYVEFFSRTRMFGDRVGGSAVCGGGADTRPGGDPAADRSIETATPGAAGPALEDKRAAARASGC